MRVRETDYLTVVILITGAVPVSLRVIFTADIMRLLVGVRRQLHRPERHRRSRICMPHLLCADQGVDVLGIIPSLCGEAVLLRENREDNKDFLHFERLRQKWVSRSFDFEENTFPQ